MKRLLALLLLLAFSLGLLTPHPCQASETRRAAPPCHAMPGMPGMAMKPAPAAPIASRLVHAAGHGCRGLPGRAGDSTQCERACCLLAVLYIPPALAAVGPSRALSVQGEELGLSLFNPSIDHIPL
jgi:hypothetical protein